MNYKPLGNNLLLQFLKKQQGNIIIPDAVVESRGVTKEYGKVIAVGSGKLLKNGKRAQVGVAVGETVLFNHYVSHAQKIHDGDEEYLIVSEDDVVGVVEE